MAQLSDQAVTQLIINHIKNGKSELVAQVLSEHPEFTSLNIEHIACQYPKEGVALSKALENNTTLSSIDIDFELYDEGANALAIAIEKNTSLTSIKLHAPNIAPEFIKALTSAVEKIAL